MKRTKIYSTSDTGRNIERLPVTGGKAWREVDVREEGGTTHEDDVTNIAIDRSERMDKG